MRISIFLCCCIFFLLQACGGKEVYYQFKEIENARWKNDDVLEFELDTLRIQDGIPYNISIEVTNNITYPYRNLWIFSSLGSDDSTFVEKQHELTLAGEDGVWLGKGFASLYQSSHRIANSFRFDDIKNSRLYIKHGMTDEELKGIEKIGLKIESVE